MGSFVGSESENIDEEENELENHNDASNDVMREIRATPAPGGLASFLQRRSAVTKNTDTKEA